MKKAKRTDFLELLDSYPDTCIAFGADSMTQLEAWAIGSGAKSFMVFMGGQHSSVASGAWQAIMDGLATLDLNIQRHTGIPPEPDIQVIESMVAALEAERPDAVIAAGGGSVMDAAKAAYISWQTGLHISKLFGSNAASSAFPDRNFKRVLCVPTTSGTGSEVTPYTNIVDRSRGVKAIIADKAIAPEAAFVNPSLTLSSPPGLTIATALDALTHATEAFLNARAAEKNPHAVPFALEAIRLVVEALPDALKNPASPSARTRLSAASTLAGMSITYMPTSLPHLCSYSFYDRTPHGLAVSAMLPHFWLHYLENPEIAERTMQLKEIFPGRQKIPQDIVVSCADFIVSCGGTVALKELPGCSKDLIASVAKAAGQNPLKLETAPKPVPLAVAEALMLKVLGKAWDGFPKN